MKYIEKGVLDILSDYKDMIDEEVEKAIKSEARKAVTTLKSTSPKNTGDYAKGWSTNKTSKGSLVGVTIYNKNKPTLVHLLENGHAMRNGGREAGQPHVKPVEDSINETLGNKIVVAINNVKG